MSRTFDCKDIKDDELQGHIHQIGLQAFLKQLERVLHRAYNDTANFDVKNIPTQYSVAASEIQELHRCLFPVNGDNHGK